MSVALYAKEHVTTGKHPSEIWQKTVTNLVLLAASVLPIKLSMMENVSVLRNVPLKALSNNKI